MRRYIATMFAVAALPVAVSAAVQPDEGPPRWAANIARKQHVIMQGLPPVYAALRDPAVDNEGKLRRGAAVFSRHCSSCHGWTGQGTGPEAFALVPAPADLEWLARTPKEKAGSYMYWAIGEGGREFESDMPAFKRSLPKRDIWAVIAYIRAGLPRKTP